MKYIFLVTAYNAERWIDKCVKSIIFQKRLNWICILCDDGSSDNTYNIMAKYKNSKIFLFKNNINKGACYMRYYGIQKYKDIIDDEDVILLIGGDDWLAHDKVLNIIDRVYKKGAEVTYGNFKYSDNKYHKLRTFPNHVLENNLFRSYPWISTAINTFKYKLFKQINPKYLKNTKGDWLKNCTDLAIMFPMLELANPKNIMPIHHIIYVYNNKYSSNTLNRFGKKNKTQINKYIRKLPKY